MRIGTLVASIALLTIAGTSSLVGQETKPETAFWLTAGFGSASNGLIGARLSGWFSRGTLAFGILTGGGAALLDSGPNDFDFTGAAVGYKRPMKHATAVVGFGL